MSHFDATPRDWWRKKKKLEHDPLAALKAHVNSSETVPLPKIPTQPYEGLVSDPMLEWGKAFEKYQDFQARSGSEIMRSGIEPQTSADLDNVRTAQEQANQQDFPRDMMAPPEAYQPFMQPRFFEPFNNPFSTVPGGMPFMNPMGPMSGA